MKYADDRRYRSNQVSKQTETRDCTHLLYPVLDLSLCPWLAGRRTTALAALRHEAYLTAPSFPLAATLLLSLVRQGGDGK